jgi:hypothetical protein
LLPQAVCQRICLSSSDFSALKNSPFQSLLLFEEQKEKEMSPHFFVPTFACETRLTLIQSGKPGLWGLGAARSRPSSGAALLLQSGHQMESACQTP